MPSLAPLAQSAALCLGSPHSVVLGRLYIGRPSPSIPPMHASPRKQENPRFRGAGGLLFRSNHRRKTAMMAAMEGQ